MLCIDVHSRLMEPEDEWVLVADHKGNEMKNYPQVKQKYPRPEEALALYAGSVYAAALVEAALVAAALCAVEVEEAGLGASEASLAWLENAYERAEAQA